MQIEDHLKKFVAAEPPPELRGRLLAAAWRRRPSWPLLAKAAAVLVMLWALNHQAETSLRAVLAGGARSPRVENTADTRVALLSRLGKEVR